MRLVTRFSRLPPERRALLVEAAARLSVVSAALSVLPFKRVIRLGSTTVAKKSATDAGDVVWAVEAAARRLPWRNVCIHKGIVAQRMLRRRGFDATLHYGIGHENEQLTAHVWVSLGGTPIIGGEEARSVAPVAAFP